MKLVSARYAKKILVWRPEIKMSPEDLDVAMRIILKYHIKIYDGWTRSTFVWSMAGIASNLGLTAERSKRFFCHPVSTKTSWIHSVRLFQGYLVFPAARRPGSEVDRWAPVNTEVMNEWRYIYTPPMPSGWTRGQLYIYCQAS
jgi:hypothetical protein